MLPSRRACNHCASASTCGEPANAREGFVAPTGKQQELDSIDRFEFGVRLNQGFEIGAELHSRSPKDAEKLAASLGSLKAMLAMAQEAGRPQDRMCR